jgi:S-adenosylmethionine:tRNA ribosyltransferase-isomerase
MQLEDFDYALPEALIAQQPAEPRDAARLLVLDRASAELMHRHVRDLPQLLREGDLLVANRSRVLPARIHGTLRGGGQAEVLLLRNLDVGRWQALVRPARRLRIGDTVSVADDVTLEIVDVQPEGVREITVQTTAANKDARLLAHGSVPLPPYIKRWRGDPERYQTVYASELGSAAAPTAGLHFTPDLIERLRQRGVLFETLLLHVGLDTFRPVTEAEPGKHKMHREWFEIPPRVQARVHDTRTGGGRVIAVGTTSVRALETWATRGIPEGWTDLFIVPGHGFASIDGMLTNFHLPRSTLLMLVSAFAGRERVLRAYAEAVRMGYRFYSFGDATLMT